MAFDPGPHFGESHGAPLHLWASRFLGARRPLLPQHSPEFLQPRALTRHCPKLLILPKRQTADESNM